MRPLEILLIVASLLAFVTLVVPLPGNVTWLRRTPPPVALLVMGAHLLVEGPRWQMVPVYALSGLFFLAWLPQTLAAQASAAGGSRIRRLAMIVGAVLGVLGLAVSATVPAVFPVFRLPRPTGPYDIGTVTYHWVDADRAEAFTADPGDRRELMVQLWYPAKADPSSPRAPYLEDSGTLAPLARLLKLPTFTFSHLKYVRTNAVPSAPVADDETSYPVLIFSHGRGGYRQHNTWQIEELVSHGYVVAAIDHPYAAAGVVFPDGRMAPMDPRMAERTGVDWWRRDFASAMLPYLAQDAIFTLDQLTALNQADPKGIVTGRLDLTRAGIFGASLGGGVSAEACRLDRRFRACLVMDMHMPADVVQTGLQQPTMWLSRDTETMRQEGWPQGYIDEIQTTMRAVFEKMLADGYLVRIPGAYHLDFGDADLLSPLASLLGITGPIGGERARSIIGSYSKAFFDQHLKGQRQDLLDGASAQFPEVLFESRQP